MYGNSNLELPKYFMGRFRLINIDVIHHFDPIVRRIRLPIKLYRAHAQFCSLWFDPIVARTHNLPMRLNYLCYSRGRMSK
jgi:hypothetical protein